MEAWTFIFWLGNSSPARKLDVQNEDACVLIARMITEGLPVDGVCINSFDGKVLFFRYGKQVEKL